jgi:hypothetical protein
MLAIVFAMLLVLVVSVAVVAYVAFPHRGEEMPYLPQVGEVMRKGVEALPTLEDSQSRS